jgi:hypothetical protein
VIGRVFLVVPALVLLSWLPINPANADCAAEPTASGGIATADVVFVGTVIDVANSGRYATFAVEEVWKGSADDEVVVHGGPPDPSGDEFVTSSAERRYELGLRYLVTAYDNDIYTGAGGVLGDNTCSGTTVWTDSLAGLRPTDATIVERDQAIVPRTHDRTPPYLMIILTTVFVAGGCLYLLFRRGSIAYRARGDEQDDTSHDF